MERFKKLGYSKIIKTFMGFVVQKESGERVVFENQKGKIYYAKIAGDNLPELVSPEEHKLISKIMCEELF